MKSILQTEKVCFFTGDPNVDRHEVYFGSNRQVSIKNGLYVYLRHDRHIADSPFATPHNNREIDLYLKRVCQEKYELDVGTREEFMKLIGKNYL